MGGEAPPPDEQDAGSDSFNGNVSISKKCGRSRSAHAQRGKKEVGTFLAHLVVEEESVEIPT